MFLKKLLFTTGNLEVERVLGVKEGHQKGQSKVIL